jgi:glycosyltransferase involved in cell wall biosynthesis
MSPLVSVIVPCLNGAPWLADAIESCLGQTYKNLQVIIIDNGSTDESLEVAGRYGSSVEVLKRECKGASAARNMGLAHAKGELVQFLDADDVLDRDKIGAQIERLASAPVGSVASGGWARFGTSTAEARFAAEPVWRDLAPQEFLIVSWRGGGMMPNFAWLAPRQAIERAGPWNEQLSLNDDGEFFCRVVLASSGIVFCERARGYYRTGSASALSRRWDRTALVSCFSAVDLSCRELLRRSDSKAAAIACATQYQRFAFEVYPAAPDLVATAERRVAELGGSELRIGGGRTFSIMSDALGWKLAKRCRSAWHGLCALAMPGP